MPKLLEFHPGPQPLIHQVFEAWAKEFPNKIAVQWGERSISYRELNRRANYLAQYLLKKRGLAVEGKVALILESSINFIVSIYAVLKAGGCVVVLDTPNSSEAKERFDYCLKLAESDLIITTSDQTSDLELEDNKLVYLDSLSSKASDKYDTNPILEQLGPKNLAYLTFTSGSTGSPKGILIEHEGIYSKVAAHQQVMQLDYEKKESMAQFCLKYVDAMFMEVFCALSTGVQLQIIPESSKQNLGELQEYFKTRKITAAIFTPTVLGLLEPKKLSTSLRVIISL